MSGTTNVTKLFRELRKMGYNAKQRAGDCRSCAQTDESLEVYTTTQSYGRTRTVVYFQTIEGTIILEAVRKLGLGFRWGAQTQWLLRF